MKARIPNIHPGEFLMKEFLSPLGISQYRLSKDILVPQTRISQIVQGKRGITADTALRLARYFKTTPQFWLNLQSHYELRELEMNPNGEIGQIQPSKELV